jgi:hypothetical protein
MRGRWWWMREGLLLLLVLLAGCGSTVRSGESTATSTLSSTAAPTATPAPTATATVAGADPALSISACDANAASQPGFTLGDLRVSLYPGLAYPGRKLPDGTPLTPFQLAATSGSALDAQLPLAPAVNPGLAEPTGGYTVTICNTSKTTAHTITAVRLSITAMTPYTGQLNEWMSGALCATYYTRPNGVQGGGCGGGIGGANCMHVSFAATAGAGTVAQAAATGARVGGGCNSMFALPLKLAPNLQLPLVVGLTPPTAPGTYTFAIGIGVDGGAVTYSPGQEPMLLAPIAHQWDGQACQANAMQSQIPAATNPPTYYICPES